MRTQPTIAAQSGSDGGGDDGDDDDDDANDGNDGNDFALAFTKRHARAKNARIAFFLRLLITPARTPIDELAGNEEINEKRNGEF